MSKKKPGAAAAKPAKKRNVIFVTLDEETEERLVRFINSQRIKPERSAVGFAALIEFLEREEKKNS